jgi:2-dehydro-3-deoxy-D-gluconate 5-dehydrogenase
VGTHFDFEGKRAVVTGGALGIGFGIASAFRAAGADLLVADIDGDALAGYETRLPSGPGKVITVEVDLTEDGAPGRVVSTARDGLGGVDVLVNCAGIYPRTPLLELTVNEFDRIIGLNLRAGLFMIQAAVPAMPAEGGAIVNIASIDALHPSVPGLSVYGASKGGLVAATRALALELAPQRIRVNAVCPGSVQTDGGRRIIESMPVAEAQAMLDEMCAAIPWRRMGRPDDVAAAVLFLASDVADYITGSYLVVDGGALIN